MTAGTELTHLTISLEFAGQRWVVSDEDTSGPTWVNTVNVADYATYGVGLYKVIGESGPDHRRVFQSEVSWQEKILATGKGKSKKEAEARAAAEALRAKLWEK